MWAWMARCPCGRKLDGADGRWLDVYASIARRDAKEMVATGTAALQATQGIASPATETAALAAAMGYICQGEKKAADTLLTNVARRSFRKNQRETELRYIYGLTDAGFNLRAPDGPCTKPAAPAPKATSPARRSP